MSTELIAHEPTAAPVRYDSEKREVLKKTLAAGATDAELEMFVQLCQSTGLNPFKREVWFIKDKRGRVQIMTGVHGFYQIANKHPMFDGIELEYGEEQTLKAGKETIVAPSWVDARVFRKDRSRPQVFRAYWREYAQDLVTSYGNLTIWAQKPSVMLAKCAESMALRKAFPQELNGLYTAEEMPAEYARPREKHKTLTAHLADEDNYVDIEAEQAANYAKRQNGKEYRLEFGGYKGTPLSEISKGPYLKNHLEKYREKLSTAAIDAIGKRLAELREEYKRQKEAEEKAAVKPADEAVSAFVIESPESDYCGRSLADITVEGCIELLNDEILVDQLADRELKAIERFVGA